MEFGEALSFISIKRVVGIDEFEPKNLYVSPASYQIQFDLYFNEIIQIIFCNESNENYL